MKDRKIFNATLRNIRNDQLASSLKISSQNLTNDDILLLAEALVNNQSLTSLYLGWNQIGSVGARGLAKNVLITSLKIWDYSSKSYQQDGYAVKIIKASRAMCLRVF